MSAEDPIEIEDSCGEESNSGIEDSKEQIIVGNLSDSVEIVEDSYVEDQ